jgi:hypothetical protein
MGCWKVRRTGHKDLYLGCISQPQTSSTFFTPIQPQFTQFLVLFLRGRMGYLFARTPNGDVWREAEAEERRTCYKWTCLLM